MGLKKSTLCFLLMLVLLLASKEAVPAAEAGSSGTCKYVPSGTFHHKCFSDSKCYDVCIGEGYSNGGYCDGYHHRCMCKRCY